MSIKASGCRHCSSKFDDIRSCVTVVEGVMLVVICISLRQYVGCNLCDLCCDASIVANAHANVSQQFSVELSSLQSILMNNHKFSPILSNSLKLSSRPITKHSCCVLMSLQRGVVSDERFFQRMLAKRLLVVVACVFSPFHFHWVCFVGFFVVALIYVWLCLHEAISVA